MTSKGSGAINEATRRASVLRGASITSIFGLVWWFAGAGTLPSPVGIPLLAVGLVLTALLLWRARRQLGNLSGVTPSPPGQNAAYGRIVLAEIVAIVIAVILSNVLDQPEITPSLVVIVVGIHFIPLARLFGQRRYLGVGAALTAVGIAGLALVLAGVLDDTLWLTVPAIGAAVIIWADAVLAVTRGNDATLVSARR